VYVPGPCCGTIIDSPSDSSAVVDERASLPISRGTQIARTRVEPRSSVVAVGYSSGGAGIVPKGAVIDRRAGGPSPNVPAVARTAVASWPKIIASGSGRSTFVGSATNPRAIVDC